MDAFHLVFAFRLSAMLLPPPANNEFFCLPLDYEDMRARDSLYAATKQALNLNVGEPRTVRMIYFLPNDRPFQQAVVDSMKVTIRQIQTFYADQMEAHGYGRKTFRFETDAQGEPLVHRVDGQYPDSHYPDSHYLDDTVDTVFDEIEQLFDVRQNIYFVAIDNSINLIGRGSGRVAGGVGSPHGKNGGVVLVSGGYSFSTAAHELGHAFSLRHYFRDNAYIMSYGGSRRNRLSACHAEFLSVHPYFNASILAIAGSPPTIDIISTTEYTAGSKSIPVQLSVHDEDELHQVILFVQTREPHFAAGSLEVKACRGLPDQYDYDAVVEFDYDGVIPSGNSSSLWNPDTHPIVISAVDAKGNVRNESFELTCKNCSLMLVKNSGDNQQGAPGSLLANPLMVEVRDKNGAGIEDIPVTFTITTGDGKLSGRFTVENTTTDADGRAQSTLTLGPIAGTNTVEVSVAGYDPVTFNAVGVGTPAIPIMGGDYQTWHLPDGAIVRLGKGTIGKSDRAVPFSPDGQRLAVASGIGVWLYEVATSRPLALLPSESSVNSVMFSPDGVLLASGNHGGVELWEVETGTKVATLKGHVGAIHSVVFSPDGTMLAAGSGVIKLWDVATRSTIATLREYNTVEPKYVSFSPDGTILAAASGLGLKLWDVASKKIIATLEGRNAMFSSDGSILASVIDGTILLWDVSPYITPQTPASTPTPDFDGDGLVGIPDFLLFVDQFGFSQRDAGYEARFDLDGDGVIGIGDFLIFVDNFGKKVS